MKRSNLFKRSAAMLLAGLMAVASTAGTISYYDETGSDEEEGAAGQPISVEGYLQTVLLYNQSILTLEFLSGTYSKN